MTPRFPRRRHLGLSLVVAVLVLAGVPALSAPGDSYVRPHFGDRALPAGCLLDLDPANPDNECYHLKVGLNALDSPMVDVAVLVPVSPAAERDLRVVEQAIHMWEGGLDQLAGEMGMEWLRDGTDFRIRGYGVPVDAEGGPEQAIDLVDPEIVVVASNPAGGIGIGIDPSDFASQIGITDGEGVPCASISDPFSLDAWQERPGYDGHHGKAGGIYVEDCGGVGGNVCFAVNGAVDPAPGTTDFFGLFDLVAHEVGHCLTLGHVGDGADGPWGPTAVNDIMAYSTDPPGLSKCVSTLDVEGFALQMSKYLDRDGDGTVTARDELRPNDVEGDGTTSFHVQHPDDHHYASATGDPEDCPQPDTGALPGAVTDWTPATVATTAPRLSSTVTLRDGRLSVAGTAARVPLAKQPTARRGAAADPSGDARTPVTDIERVEVAVTRTHVEGVLHVARVNPVSDGASLTAYSLLVSGRRFDSFIANGTTDGTPTTLDNGQGTVMPAGTSTWDVDAGTVRFRIPRRYLAGQHIAAPYEVKAMTGVHARTNDWLATDDVAPDGRAIGVTGPRMSAPSLDAPVAARRTTKRVALQHEGGNSFTAADSSFGLPLVPVGTKHVVDLPVGRQAAVEVTLAWDDPGTLLALAVKGGSETLTREGDGSVTVTVPWARRGLQVVVDPLEVLSPGVDYTLTAKLTTLTRADDRDGDRVPDTVDLCDGARGPAAGAGCPDTDRDLTPDRHDRCPRVPGTGATGCPAPGDERVVVLLDGRRVAGRAVLTDHRAAPFRLAVPVGRGSHRVRVVWYDGSRVLRSVTRRVG